MHYLNNVKLLCIQHVKQNLSCGEFKSKLYVENLFNVLTYTTKVVLFLLQSSVPDWTIAKLGFIVSHTSFGIFPKRSRRWVSLLDTLHLYEKTKLLAFWFHMLRERKINVVISKQQYLTSWSIKFSYLRKNPKSF